MKIPIIALAHHADDQLELFFLRLFRGSGPEGLAGMKWRSASPSDGKIELVRPLLDLPKSVLREYAVQQNIPFREDATNQHLNFQRNRIRHELLPLLRKKYQPSLHKTVLRAMELLGADADFITVSAEDWVASVKAPVASNPRFTSFEDLPVTIQRKSLQLQLFQLGIDPDYELIEHLREAPEKPLALESPRAKAPAQNVQLFVCMTRQGLICSKSSAANQTFSSASLALALNRKSGGAVFDGLKVSWRKHGKAAIRGSKSAKSAKGEVFDAHRVGNRVVLRHWQPGDRFQPIGMQKSVKLQDFFTNEKIPRPRRQSRVLATSQNGEIFWVEGLRISERFKLTHGTKCRLQWHWERI